MSGPSTYEPASGFTRWLDKRLPILRLTYDSFVAYPTPRNLNYWWTFGAILSMCLVVQIVTGVVIAMHYIPSNEPMTAGSTYSMAFASVQRFKRDVSFGWLIQPIHAVGASMFFLAAYIHMFRGLYYGSYKAPREVLWILGCIIYFLMIATAFLGYSLPWGQMSFWAATVITNLIGAIPWIGDSVRNWLVGGFAVGAPTLNRFYSLHYLLPFVIAGVVVLHIWALHVSGQNNPAGVDPKSKEDTVPFTPHATMKDLFVTALFMVLFAVFVFYMPDKLGHPDNYIPANPLQTPPEIVPEWYLLPFYAILRAIDFNVGLIDSKLGGVILMFSSIAVLFVLPWLDTSKVRSMRYRPSARLFFIIFVAVCLGLGWCGSKSPATALLTAGDFKATLSWVEGGQVVEHEVSGGAGIEGEIAKAEAALKSDEHAQVTYSRRTSATAAIVKGAVGGELRTATVTASNVDALDAAVAAKKAEVGAAAPFFHVVRYTPFVFSVTTLAQALTAYYFLFFLVILPLLGLRENPNAAPDTIAKSVAGAAAKEGA